MRKKKTNPNEAVVRTEEYTLVVTTYGTQEQQANTMKKIQEELDLRGFKTMIYR